jgi:hypothetical protein
VRCSLARKLGPGMEPLAGAEMLHCFQHDTG